MSMNLVIILRPLISPFSNLFTYRHAIVYVSKFGYKCMYVCKYV